MLMLDERQIADALLVEWHDWCDSYRPALGADRASATCRQALSGRQYDDSTEASCGGLFAEEMKSVAFCVAQLSVIQQISIGIELKGRLARNKVWRHGSVSYDDCLTAVVPIMRKRGLFDGK